MDYSFQQSRFNSWVQQHRGIVIKIARSFTGTSADYDDLLQEILLQLWKSIPAFQDQCKDSTWIYRVALNRALLWRRSETKRQTVSSNLAKEPPELSSVDPHQEERIDALYRALRRLRKDERALILLALEGLSYREIANIVEISESNVGVRLTRIKKQLHQLLT